MKKLHCSYPPTVTIKENYVETHYFECQCGGDEHMLKFVVDDEDFYLNVFLNQYRGFFHRLWIAIKYVFGYKCKYGHWDSWMLRPEDVQRLKGLLDKHVPYTAQVEPQTKLSYRGDERDFSPRIPRFLPEEE